MALVLTNNLKWENFVIDFLFSNYGFEYFIPKREVYEDGYFFNMIKFPKSENGSLVSRRFLKGLILNILMDEQLMVKIFGVDCINIHIEEDEDAISIIWNKVEDDEYYNFASQADRDRLYHYSISI